MSLNLGRIPFSPDRSPWVHRRRSGKESARLVGAATGPPVRAAAGDAGNESDLRSRLAELTIRPAAFGPVDVRFLVGATEERMGRALTASLASHIVAGSLLALLISLMPAPVYELIIPNRERYSLVWIPEEGPGGGGGGGGNESLELPPVIEVEGTEETPLSVPVQEESDFVEPEVEPEVLQTQEMNIPAVSMAAAPQTRSGVLDGLAVDAAVSQGSGSGGGGGTGEGTGSGSGTAAGLGPGEGGGVGGGVYRPGAGIVNPRLLREVRPQYTSEALRAKITGTVYLEMVVLADGTVGDVRITRSLDPVFGLDEEAIKAAKQWLFEPGTRFGEPVAILVNLALDFNLR